MKEIEKTKWFKGLKLKYHRWSKKQKKLLLDSLEQTLGIHRKSAIRLLKKKTSEGGKGVVEQVKDIESSLPFTPSRPYHKNDNAHVEQKNWTHPRQLFGRIRMTDC